MSTAPTEPLVGSMKQADELTAVKGLKRSNFGSCNGCTNGTYKITGDGDELVTEIRIRNHYFRLCESCRLSLKKQL